MNRRLALRSLLAALEQPALPEVWRRRLIKAARLAVDGESLDQALTPGMTAEERDQRDLYLLMARDALGNVGYDRLAREAELVERRLIAGEIDPDRPRSWPALKEHEQYLVRALALGPLVSRSRFYEIRGPSGSTMDRTASCHHGQNERSDDGHAKPGRRLVPADS